MEPPDRTAVRTAAALAAAISARSQMGNHVYAHKSLPRLDRLFGAAIAALGNGASTASADALDIPPAATGIFQIKDKIFKISVRSSH